MDLERYALTAIESRESYEFLSEGPRGRSKRLFSIRKWNQTFITNKILATLAGSVALFMREHPDVILVAMEQTPAKTRLS